MTLKKPTETRPWGSYQNLAEEAGFLVKLIEVLPGKRFSLQKHFKRSEYWTVVKGRGIAEVDGKTIQMETGVTVHVPRTATHRMQANANEPLLILELQTGECREDDIERLQDDFGRIGREMSEK